MKRERHLSPLPVFDETALTSVLEENNFKPIHARTVQKYLLRSPGASMENLHLADKHFPPGLVELIQNHFALLTSKIVSVNHSQDMTVTKLLVELQDGLRVETVIIRHGATTARRVTGESRTTLCVSSQIGCKMACTFCATGTMGEIGNMFMGEILEQLIHARRYSEISNIVFMGMGEPLNNYECVIPAVKAMVDSHRFQLAPNRVTVSTVGIVPRMRDFIRDCPNIHLALSLHAPTQESRLEIVPAAKTYPLHVLMQAVQEYLDTGRRLLIEYVLLKDINDSETRAHELGALLKGKNVLVNLIPFNPVAGGGYQAPEVETTQRFLGTLCRDYELMATVRKEMGRDIAGACGQLVVSKKDQKLKDIEDTLGGKTTAPEGDLKIDAFPRPSSLWPDVNDGKNSSSSSSTASSSSSTSSSVRSSRSSAPHSLSSDINRQSKRSIDIAVLIQATFVLAVAVVLYTFRTRLRDAAVAWFH